MVNFSEIRIVLVEPAGALNVGSVARVMKNMGLAHLVLVNPQCDRLGFEARQMAVHAADVLEAAQVVGSLPEALQGCQKAIATTGRDRTTLNLTVEPPRVALPWLLDAPAALIFGREDSGLTNEELNYAQRWIQIPSQPAYPSLNLAQAVAICCYEIAGVGSGEWGVGSGEMGRWDGWISVRGTRGNWKRGRWGGRMGRSGRDWRSWRIWRGTIGSWKGFCWRSAISIPIPQAAAWQKLDGYSIEPIPLGQR